MNKTFKTAVVGLVVAILLSGFMAGSVFAQGNTTPAPAPRGWFGWGHGLRGIGQAGMEAVAKLLGMTTEQLAAELWGGRTLAELADKAGVDLLTLQNAAKEANQQAMKEAIEQAVADGRLTREHADWLLQGLEKGYWGGKGLGGMGCFGGRGFSRGMNFSNMSGQFLRLPNTSSSL